MFVFVGVGNCGGVEKRLKIPSKVSDVMLY